MFNPTYEVRASFFIQDEEKRSGEKSPLHEIDLISSARVLENELEILKSKQLIGRVIEDLNLDINYKVIDGLSSNDLYNAGPVKFTLIKPSGNYEKGKMRILIKDKNGFLLETVGGESREMTFNKHYVSSFGEWKLEPAMNLGQFIGDKIQIAIADPGKLAIQYQDKISAVLPSKLSTTVALSIKDEVAQRGIDVLNRLMFNYNLAGATAKNNETQSTLAFIDNRLASLSGELSDAEKGIATFKSSRGLTDISSNSKVSLENMQTNDAQLNEVNVKLSIIEGIESYVNSNVNTGKAPATLGISDPALNSLIEKLSYLQLQRERLLGMMPETNPEFEPINRQIASTKASLKEIVGSLKSTLISTRAKLQTFNSRFESSIKNIPVQEREFISIKRQQSIKESLYTYLLQKREEVSVSYASAVANDRIIDPPYAIAPKGILKYLAMLAALIFSIAVPVGFVFIRDFFSSKITDPQEIEDLSSIPVLGELPFEGSKNAITVSGLSTSLIGEQFRALRIKLFYLLKENQGARVILVTSGLPGDGKSFVSSNLAVTLALSSRKTVIVELDMRKPKMAASLEMSEDRPGVSEYLNGEAGLKDIVQQSKTEKSLHFIGSGRMVKNPSELLERPKLAELIGQLREFYDDVIIDSPPVHLVPDAMILSQLTDVTLYVVRQGITEKPELDFISKLANKKQLLNLQIVFNGVKGSKYGYGYAYDYSYYSPGKKESVFSDFWHRF
ncbi:GumC family protein [Dyadobacter luticola]|nr:polysaccharide biosynthesis tyrosine autokinase [Dyadobacter luticola]